MEARATARPGALPAGSDLPHARQTARMVMRPLAFLEELRKKYGDVFTVRVQHEPPWVMVSDPELIGEVFKAPADVLHAGEGKRILHPVVGDNSVLLLDEDRYMKQRRLLLPPFRASRVGRYEDAMRAAAAQTLASWPVGQARPAATRMRAIALEAILHAVFGVGDSERLGPLREALHELRLPSNAREANAPAFRNAMARVDELIFAEVEERRTKRAGEAGDDVLSLLLAARHEDGSPMARAEVRDELMSLLIAGYETTATTFAWTLERLARSPEALARTEEEAADGGGPYTDAVVKETLRQRPALPLVARAVKKPYQLGTHTLPAGVTVVPAILLLHHRPDIYPEPGSFRPERFLEQPPSPHAWIPFGGGLRRCIGAHFAQLEMRVVLSEFLRRFRVRTDEPRAEGMRRRDVTLTPSRDARIVVELR